MSLTGELDLSRWEDLGELLDEFVRLHGEETFRRVQRRTPVDTGLARDSWLLAFHTLMYELINPQPYAERLENGWSDQAPLGMLHITLEEAQSIADDICRQLNSR